MREKRIDIVFISPSQLSHSSSSQNSVFSTKISQTPHRPTVKLICHHSCESVRRERRERQVIASGIPIIFRFSIILNKLEEQNFFERSGESEGCTSHKGMGILRVLILKQNNDYNHKMIELKRGIQGKNKK